MTKVHLDTDLGGDIDDICALAMLLRWPEVEISGITIVGDTNGKRTGYTRYVLGVEGRSDIPVAAGAETSGGFYRYDLVLPPENRYWPEPIAPSPNPPEKAVELLKASIDAGATVIGIGPLTNLRLLDERHPGMLSEARLVLMGGFVYPPRPGYPDWKNEFDFNIQADVRSAKYVLDRSSPTLVTISVTAETALRESNIARLRTAGALGQLLARQAEAFAEDEKMSAVYGATCERVPPDIVNFLHDPLACAVAVGWNEGVKVNQVPLIIEQVDGWLRERIVGDGELGGPGGVEKSGESGRLFNVVTEVDGARFGELWLERIAGG